MTKEEYTQVKERAAKYQSYEHELGKVDDVLKNIKQYSSFTLNTRASCGNVNIGIDSATRDNLISMLQEYRATIVGAMEKV